MNGRIYTLAFVIFEVSPNGNKKLQRWDLGNFGSIEEAKGARHAVKEYHERMGYDFDQEETDNPALNIYSEAPGEKEKLEEVYPL